MAKKIYTVHYFYPYKDSYYCAFYIGCYSSKKIAKKAIKILRKLEGYSDYPENFRIEEYTVNKICFREVYYSESD